MKPYINIDPDSNMEETDQREEDTEDQPSINDKNKREKINQQPNRSKRRPKHFDNYV